MRKNVSLIFVLCIALAGLAWADYQSEVLADSPLAYYRFEDASSTHGATAADIANRTWKNGTYINTATDKADVALVTSKAGLGQAAELHGNSSGGLGNAISIYDGGGNEISNPGGVTRQTITLETWMKSASASSYPRLIQHNSGSQGGWGIGSYPSTITVIGGGTTWYTGAPTVFDDAWHHIVVTYQPVEDIGDSIDDLYREVFVDGSVVWGDTIEDGVLTTPTNWLTIGSEGDRYYLYNGFVGLMDEVAIYDTVLSADRVAAHYAAAVPEPATLVLLGLGGLALYRRKR